METTLGCGYLINDESVITDFYSPPSSISDENENSLFYSEEIKMNNINLKDELKPLPLKLMSIETNTPPLTPLIPQRLIEPINNTIIDFQNMKINSNSPIVSSKTADTNWSLNTTLFPGTPTNLLTPTSMDRYLIEHRRLSDSIYKSSTTQNRYQSISVQHTEVTNETSRLYSYMTPVNEFPPTTASSSSSSNSWSTFDDKRSIPSQIPINNNSYMKSPLYPRQVNTINPFNQSSSSQNPWILSEISAILRQNNNNNNNNISLSTTAQQILNGNNRPLRSEKIDIEVIKHLIQEANWKRQCGMKKEICVFCRNNGENELIYSSHSLKDSIGNVTCPILRAYQCPICGATGSQAHTIKYCQSTGDDNNRHIPTPYEKMLRMQTFEFDDNITSSMPSIFCQYGSPSSLYTNGWSDSYL